jgi:tripeptidyl-peptidase I
MCALAHKFYIVMHGTTSSVDGTSASTPTIAGLVGQINSQRIEKGKPVVGFLNPLLYAVHNSTGGAAFNDITVGNNACTEQGCLCKTGFLATPGWDAATGLGTPNVGIMMEAIEALDKEREERVK